MITRHNLFHTHNNYIVSEDLIFPADEVLGFIIYTTVNFDGILQFKKLNTIKHYINGKSSITYIFTIGTTDVDAAELSFSSTDTDGVFKDLITGSYCGCMSVTDNFITWLHTLKADTLEMLPNSVILNPSYCMLISPTSLIDYRLAIGDTKLNNIQLTDSYLVKDDDSYSICRHIYNSEEPKANNGLVKLYYRTDGAVQNADDYLAGSIILFNMNPPTQGKYNKTYIEVVDNKVHFQDAGLE